MINISQKDSRWGCFRIGETNLSIARWGCTICSLCMALGALQNRFVNPKNAATYWEFNGRGEILWAQTKFNGMEFVKRYYGFNVGVMKRAVDSPEQVVVAEVNRNHWVYVCGMENSEPMIIDPIDGKRYEKLPSKYDITGFTVLRQTYQGAPDWMSEVWAKAKSLGLKEDDPLTDVTIHKLRSTLCELNLIDKEGKTMTVGELLVALDKIKERW